MFVPLVCGAGVTLGCRGAVLYKRFIAAGICGVSAGALYTAGTAILAAEAVTAGQIGTELVWRIFIFGVFTTVGAILTELKLPDPDTV